MWRQAVTQEAVLSSQIEGTQSSLADLLLYEIDEQPGVPVEDAREVSRCVAALDFGLKKLRSGFPLCVRLLCEMHKVLMASPRSGGKTPGEIRRSQVWIGGTRPGNAVFVPPPVDALPEALKHSAIGSGGSTSSPKESRPARPREWPRRARSCNW
jgi:Fic family protein